MAISNLALHGNIKPGRCAVQGYVPMCHAVLGMLQLARSSQHAIPRTPAPSQRYGAQGSCWTLQSVLRLKAAEK